MASSAPSPSFQSLHPLKPLPSKALPPISLSFSPSPSHPHPSRLSSTTLPSPSPLSSSPSNSITTNNDTLSSTSLHLLSHHLSSRDFRLADDETRRLLIALAGDGAVKRGYVFYSEVRFIDPADLRAIDALWLEHSAGRFGYSVQRRVWEKQRRDFTRFFVKVGWMKKLDSEIEQYSYRAFPDEFTWEISDRSPPEGHLPLTNALRGTQLLTSILTHPAFEVEGAVAEEEADAKPAAGGLKKMIGGFRADYSF